MAQTDMIISYSPTPKSVVESGRVNTAERRWSVALVSALLAGGALFAGGHFMAVEGRSGQPGLPTQPSAPPIKAEPAQVVPIAVRMGHPNPFHETGEPLPFLGVVRDIAPVEPAAPVIRNMSAAMPREKSSALRRTKRAAAGPKPSVAAEPVVAEPPHQAADLVASPPAEPAAGMRRDLAGFLQTQGHELVVDDTAGALIVAEGELMVGSAALAETAALQLAEAESGSRAETAEAIATVPADPLPELVPSASPAIASAASASPVVLPETVQAVPLRPAVQPVTDAPPVSASAEPLVQQSYPMAVVNGEPLGAITMRYGDAVQPTIHLGALVGLLRLRMPEAEFARLSAASATDRFVSLDELRAAGITVQLDARSSRLLIDAR